MKKVLFYLSFVVCLVLVITPAFGKSIKKCRGQTAYAPVIHNCFRWNEGICLYRGSTRLIIRNIDSDHPITVTLINLYAPDGNLVKEFLEESLIIQPLASVTFSILIDEIPLWDANDDGRPSFIVMWSTPRSVFPPIIETGRALINDSLSFWDAVGLEITPATILKEIK